MKLNSPASAIIGNFILFQALWFAAVLGAAAGLHWPAPLALAALLGWTRLSGGCLRADLRLVLIGLATGMAFEVLLLSSGLIRYELQWWQHMPPLWILCLWAGFAQSFLYSMAWMRKRLVLASLFGGIGSVMSMYAGLRFGAAQPPVGTLPLLLAYGLGWSVLVPFLAWLADESRQQSVQVES
ncbi:MAG: DUF2878 domain-containing protein [Alcanivoracaceae bacterium]|nr:DUF2878 domain-containing protein [Alcanivoracaceae bacterium]